MEDVRLVVHGGVVPKHWKHTMLGDRAAYDLDWVIKSSPRQVMGLGKVRALDIPLIPMDGR